MPAIDTFDWFKHQVWSLIDDETRAFLSDQRQYLMTIRNEDERRRYVEETIKDVKAKLRK